MLDTYLAKLHGNRSKRGYGSINSRWYGEHVLRSPDNLIRHVEFGYNNVFFVHSSGFAAEWWNNIWERCIFVVFWTLHGNAKYFGDDVYGQEGQTLFSKLTCCMRGICKWIWTVVVQLYFSWMCMSFVNNNKPIYFSAKLRFAFFFLEAAWCFWEVCGRRERFWNLWWVWTYLEMFLRWRWIQPLWIHQWEAEFVFMESVWFRCRVQDGTSARRPT